jgi:hypothetical protein
MEKFEYFPIKCRIQRAADMFQKSRADIEKEKTEENESQPNLCSVKSKVLFLGTTVEKNNNFPAAAPE